MESAREKLIKLIIEGQKSEENKKFGEFIIQTNEVQFYLSLLVLSQSSVSDKKYYEDIKNSTFGPIINLFCACAKKEESVFELIKRLREYKSQRDRLAHKMFSDKKLTKKECELAISNGEKILKTICIFLEENLGRKIIRN